MTCDVRRQILSEQITSRYFEQIQILYIIDPCHHCFKSQTFLLYLLKCVGGLASGVFEFAWYASNSFHSVRPGSLLTVNSKLNSKFTILPDYQLYNRAWREKQKAR